VFDEFLASHRVNDWGLQAIGDSDEFGVGARAARTPSRNLPCRVQDLGRLLEDVLWGDGD
jgi:hypothetical protein